MTNSLSVAPGKVILFGEHAVVYGRPAIALPINEICVRVGVSPVINRPVDSVHLTSSQIGLNSYLDELSAHDPVKQIVQILKTELSISHIPACEIKIVSTIPLSSGFGSGAAVSVALIRALANFLGITLSDSRVSDIAHKMERIHHGNPSGIDNTVIAFEKPILFEKGKPFETILLSKAVHLVVAGTGTRSDTKVVVSEVRERWLQNGLKYEKLFDEIANLVRLGRSHLERGNHDEVGILMNKNHEFLQQMGVSSDKLDRLVMTARDAGALGAKLSGAGKGGNVIALVTPKSSSRVITAMKKECAQFAFQSIIQVSGRGDDVLC